MRIVYVIVAVVLIFGGIRAYNQIRAEMQSQASLKHQQAIKALTPPPAHVNVLAGAKNNLEAHRKVLSASGSANVVIEEKK